MNGTGRLQGLKALPEPPSTWLKGRCRAAAQSVSFLAVFSVNGITCRHNNLVAMRFPCTTLSTLLAPGVKNRLPSPSHLTYMQAFKQLVLAPHRQHPLPWMGAAYKALSTLLPAHTPHTCRPSNTVPSPPTYTTMSTLSRSSVDSSCSASPGALVRCTLTCSPPASRSMGSSVLLTILSALEVRQGN